MNMLELSRNSTKKAYVLLKINRGIQGLTGKYERDCNNDKRREEKEAWHGNARILVFPQTAV
jgi:hypothetical protein